MRRLALSAGFSPAIGSVRWLAEVAMLVSDDMAYCLVCAFFFVHFFFWLSSRGIEKILQK